MLEEPDVPCFSVIWDMGQIVCSPYAAASVLDHMVRGDAQLREEKSHNNYHKGGHRKELKNRQV